MTHIMERSEITTMHWHAKLLTYGHGPTPLQICCHSLFVLLASGEDVVSERNKGESLCSEMLPQLIITHGTPFKLMDSL
jgi:hypothetical protein